ncbi:glutamate receptor ionotropic, delta-1-like [Panulirus ornatus]|uniref:glutamate receptor ionotropic, delta-1-like n=1 Tax=Panulirus ornatus TaxID=150431 RepID=UPI003A836628
MRELQVRSNVLESPTIQWFVITDENLTEELPSLLREGTQVALVQRTTDQKALLFSSRVDPDGQLRLHKVGSWSASGFWHPSSQQEKSELVPNLQEYYSDFQGRQLVVTTNDNWPFFKIKTLENGTIVAISGIDLSVINAVSEKLNFTYRLITPPDGRWGGPQPNNTITGLVGQVARHEAHATLCELFITVSRESVVDFTVPYYLGSATLVSPAPKEKNRSFAIFSTFTVDVWLCICVFTALAGPLLYKVTRFLVLYVGEQDIADYSLQSFSFNVYRNLMVQGNLITSHRWSLRFIFFSWYLFCFYIYALYSGTLTAVLAIRAFEKPIDSLHEFPQARQNGFSFGAVRDSSYADVLKSAKSGIYREVWQLFDHDNEDKSLLPSPDVGIEMVLKEKYVFINCQLNTMLQAARWGPDKFYIGHQTFLPQGCGIACSSGSPYKGAFSKAGVQTLGPV